MSTDWVLQLRAYVRSEFAEDSRQDANPDEVLLLRRHWPTYQMSYPQLASSDAQLQKRVP
jgi:hypothetical protein